MTQPRAAFGRKGAPEKTRRSFGKASPAVTEPQPTTADHLRNGKRNLLIALPTVVVLCVVMGFMTKQKATFADLSIAAKAAVDKVRGSCPIKRPRNVPDRRAMAEKRAEAALDALRTVRPAADELCAALSDEQKAEMKGLRRHRRSACARRAFPSPGGRGE